jgi:hypothetical protein
MNDEAAARIAAVLHASPSNTTISVSLAESSASTFIYRPSIDQSNRCVFLVGCVCGASATRKAVRIFWQDEVPEKLEGDILPMRRLLTAG